MGAVIRRLKDRVSLFGARHPRLRLLYEKITKDNIGVLAGFVSWSILTSIIPLTVGVVAVYSLFIDSPEAQAELVTNLSKLFQGAVTTQDINTAVNALSRNVGLLRLFGVIGVFWGASSIGGAFGTAFRLIFTTPARPFVREKLLDLAMIFIFTGLMAVIVFGTTAAAYLDKIASALPFPELTQVLLVAGISFLAALILFSAIYWVFPNIKSGYKLRSFWQGALLAAVLFQIVTIVWPLYVRLSHASRFGAVIFSIIILTAWLYAFSFILILGAEVIAVASMREMQAQHNAAE